MGRIRLTPITFFWLAISLTAALAGTACQAQVDASVCGQLKPPGQFGPYDYRTDKIQLPVVEPYHFPPAVEALIGGSSGSVSIGGNIAYTLRAFPNHHKALMAMMRYGEKMKSPQPEGAPWPVECFFERALRFRPDDIIVRMIYASFLAGNSRRTEAIQQLQRATSMAGDNALTHNNIGLIYLDLQDYERALSQAHRAVTLGHPRPSLREELKKAGRWTEPANLPVAPTAEPR